MTAIKNKKQKKKKHLNKLLRKGKKIRNKKVQLMVAQNVQEKVFLRIKFVYDVWACLMQYFRYKKKKKLNSHLTIPVDENRTA